MISSKLKRLLLKIKNSNLLIKVKNNQYNKKNKIRMNKFKKNNYKIDTCKN